jgi:hypothetical protein
MIVWSWEIPGVRAFGWSMEVRKEVLFRVMEMAGFIKLYAGSLVMYQAPSRCVSARKASAREN